MIQITVITLEENPQITNSSKYFIFPINSVPIHWSNPHCEIVWQIKFLAEDN